MKRLLKRGVTLAETIVCMSIITFISVTTISIIEEGFSQSYDSLSYAEARNVADNTYEAFKFSSNFSTFNRAMSMTDRGFDTFKQDAANSIYIVTYEFDKCTLSVELTYDYGSYDYYSAVCRKSAEKELFTLSYKKPHESEATYE